MSGLKKEFQEKGYVVLENTLTEKEIEQYIQALQQAGKDKKKASWTIPDGVIQYPEFWDTIFNQQLLDKVREVLGPDIRFLQHNDLHLGYSSFAWHRDGINRSYGSDLPDWDEEQEPYELVRCGFYLQPESSGFHLGVLPGSHRMSGHLSREEFLLQDEKLSNFQNVKVKLGMKDYLKEKAEWIATKPGTCVIFDPRLIHTGGGFEAAKYSYFIAFGRENKHFRQHYTYYRHLRKDLGYSTLPEALAQRLKDADLYADESAWSKKIKGAWIPSAGFSFVADFFE